MDYKQLAEVYDSLSSTTKRLEKIDILAEFLKKIPEKQKDILYLLMGDIYPEYDGRRIGISNKLAAKAISKSTGVEEKEVINLWKSIGDLGKVAAELTKNKRQQTLQTKKISTSKVLENLRKLPELEGKGSVGRKLFLITELLSSASALEALYIIRTLIGDLRIGVQESTIREAMAKAFFKRTEENSRKIQEAIDRSNDIAAVFEIAKKRKIGDLKKLQLQVGKPIKAMLAQKVENIEEGFKALGKPCVVEYKYDGFRIIIHKKGKEVTLFTRRLEDVTKQFPEVVEYVLKYVKGKSFILDSEAVGYNKKTKEYTSFQHISQRIRRKYNIKELRNKLPVEVNVFDILYYNGKSLLNEPFKERTKIVHKIIKDVPYKIISAKQIITGDEKKAKKFYRNALKDRQEGVMMKNLNAIYQPGRRVGHMMKIKPEVKDLDLVIVGGEYGAGKRFGWISSFILACRNKKGEYLPIGKMGTGIKEKAEQGMSFEQLTKIVKPYITEEKGKSVKIKPKVIVSATYQEIQRSPNYESGFALRFPRFTALRPDKALTEITSLEELEEDYKNQKRNYRYG